jgi:hypothetical protein
MKYKKTKIFGYLWIIETDQETESNFYLVNIGARGLVYKDGMIDFTIQN